jgi:hypothetical protein
MRKIKILIAIFLSLFVMVTLQSCDKEAAEVTYPESQEDVTETDKPLEKEGGVRLEPFEGGFMFIADNYIDVDLHPDYYFTDFYVDNSKTNDDNDYITIPVDVGTNMYREFPFYERYIVFRAKRYTSGMEVIKDLYLSYEYNCTREGFSIVKCLKGPDEPLYFSLKGSGSNVFLCKKTGTGTNGAIKNLRIVFYTDRFFSQKILLDNGYIYDTTNTNEGSPSPKRVYIGWSY